MRVIVVMGNLQQEARPRNLPPRALLLSWGLESVSISCALLYVWHTNVENVTFVKECVFQGSPELGLEYPGYKEEAKAQREKQKNPKQVHSGRERPAL